ncbi:very short patch repair endonuclease [Bacteroides cellulosilyticus]|uniref:very short patch repair endonuclease n=1 Tax=Bacteroides cellulosilyticus TaxID=246787 RepID=UPI001C37805D|nr:DNA mismatch endonuclease Vsr [Bacteroides cellulosilyticus]MBV3637685.1 DNA mismatch endonuclease Vsr [Bacteroides cellulosilyticus]MBV3663937.1 DNA mismatch endonuclease Vsr [Bacteroides cellulosilyticus]MBV3685928.1 DNA mismatch endonuclease Vsr [Bacteroides cellulosilyticus]MBV3696522.1 DNA mismatch endonuclease Vsr [Bacteroides cellulosilyticus]MBV3708225.1 DNA mismatch endonuclease Vsr [Bacteroides cellulosilyticus]
MSDIYSKSKRSDIMSKISGKETKPEILVRKYLFSKGFRFRKNVKGLPGKPDIVLPKYKVIIFIHGCFWHGHSCKRGNLPSSNIQFWENKISQNLSRDKNVTQKLKELGWKVIIIWQCEIQNNLSREIRLDQLISDITEKNE